MPKTAKVVATLAILTVLATASTGFASPLSVLLFYDDIEGDVSAWTTTDFTASAAPHFHWDTYLAFDGMSWWCGNFDYDSNGGYGNGWDDRLELPPVSVNPVPVEEASWGEIKSLYHDGPTPNRERMSRDVIPVLTFVFRHDSEVGYDFTYVQAESNGVYVNLNRGYDGVQDWTDLGPYGFDLSSYDDPLNVRFRFISDGAWSDEDGLYTSDGGSFACDNVKIYDFMTGDVLFYDSEPGAREDECIPSTASAAGDYWHVIERRCPAYSDPHCWWCGDDADTNLIPPNLQSGLWSPLVDLSGAWSCTVGFAMHFAVPTVDNDYVSFYGTADVYEGYYAIASYWGDFRQCDGWSSAGFRGFDITQFGYPPYGYGGFLWIMCTSDNGCGPAVNGGAGIMLDDVFFFGGVARPERNGPERANVYDAEPYPGWYRSALGRRVIFRR